MKKVLAIIICILLTGMTMGCTTDSKQEEQGSNASEEKKEDGGSKKFGFAATTMNNPFFHAIESAVREEVEARGDELIVVDAQNDAQKQLALVEDMIVQGIDCLFICPVDSASIKSALQRCNEAGIPVVNFDTDVIDTDLVDSIIVSDNYKAGELVAKDMMAKLEQGAKVCILTSPSAEACVKRVNGFKDVAGDYFEIVSELDGKGDTAESLGIAEDVLQGNSDLAAFYAINDPSALGCIQALESQKMEGVLVYGVDGQPDGKKAVEEGKMEATAAQSPVNIGKISAETAYKILSKSDVEHEIAVETFLIDKQNVKEYGLDGWQ